MGGARATLENLFVDSCERIGYGVPSMASSYARTELTLNVAAAAFLVLKPLLIKWIGIATIRYVILMAVAVFRSDFF